MIQIEAFAKINLGLDVLGRRPDGYHEVKMVMQTVGISDLLTFERRPEGICVRTDSQELPADENNLVYKAARLIMEQYRINAGAEIFLKKRIPIAAGMAGGSTDAAAAMRGISELYGLKLSDEEMQRLGVRIGADVPFCVTGGTVLAEGIGERLTPLNTAPQSVLLIVKPDINVSTKYVYEHLDAKASYEHPDIDGMTKAVRNGDREGIISRLGNVLESVTIQGYPVVEQIKRAMTKNGAKGCLMSGSGPTVFGFYGSEKEAWEAAKIIQENALAEQIFVTGFVAKSWRKCDGR